MEAVFVLALALTIDLTLGEPPLPIHPVVWMGKTAGWMIKGGRRFTPAFQFVYGTFVVLLTIAMFALPTYFLLAYLRGVNVVVYVLVSAVILKTTFSLRELRRAANRVKRRLLEDRLPEARFELRALVKRNTSQLTDRQVVSAAVESVAENACDSFVAPLFYFLFLGIPGAMAFRVINTLDAMIGYHGEFEYLGKSAARLDTVANFIPARITALLIVLAAAVQRRHASKAWRIALRDRRKTESPNAGWTMSAMAGALDVQLEKVGYYRLGDAPAAEDALSPTTIDASTSMLMVVAFISTALVIIARVVYYYVAA